MPSFSNPQIDPQFLNFSFLNSSIPQFLNFKVS
jgi:hypothetical protein